MVLGRCVDTSLLVKVCCIRRLIGTSAAMSHSKYEYVRRFEADDRLLPNTWIVVRLDGKAFHKFTDTHDFKKPNDKTALDLMNSCAKAVLSNYPDLVLAYGQSDEYSFVFRKDTNLYSRRSFKLGSNIVSLFSSSYVMDWPSFFPEKTLNYPPSFDARTVLYPSDKNLRDYLSWRQADCHINNLYNTAFWALVQQGGLTNHEAQERLKGTVSSDKNEILFSQFGVNYNNEPEQFRKGTVIYRKRVEIPAGSDRKKGEGEGGAEGDEHQSQGVKVRGRLVEETCDIIGDTFWQQNCHILEPHRDS